MVLFVLVKLEHNDIGNKPTNNTDKQLNTDHKTQELAYEIVSAQMSTC